MAISLLLNDTISLIMFIFTLSWILFQKRRIDALGQYAWIAFLLVIPFSAFLSLVLFQEKFNVFLIHLGCFAVLIASFQLLSFLLPFFPTFLRYPALYFQAFFYDGFALLTFFILFRERSWKETPKKVLENNKTPILLIHGYGHDAGAWIFHGPQLSQGGFGPLFTIDLGSVEHSIQDYAERIEKKARAIAQETRTADLIMIGYSMGGLVAAYYAFHLAPEHSVKGIITLGSPLAGTKIAPLGKGSCSEEMHYQSSFVRELKQKIVHSPIPFWHIGSQSDTIVFPASSAWMEGHRSTNIYFEELGHLSLLYSNKISQCFQKILSHSPPSSP